MAIPIGTRMMAWCGVWVSVGFYLLLNWENSFAKWTLIVISGLSALACYDIYRLDPSESHSSGSLWSLYIFKKALKLLGFLFKNHYENRSNFRERQEQLLVKLLSTYEQTAYGKDHKFDKMKSIDDFVKGHPVTAYDHYEQYFDRQIKGETNVIIPGTSKVTYIILTSGTTGNNKRYPVSKTKDSKQFTYTTYMIKDHMLMINNCFEAFPGANNMWKSLDILIIQEPIINEYGIPQGGLSGLAKSLLPGSATPLILLDVNKEDPALYLYALFGLKERKLTYIQLGLATVGLKFLKGIERNWEQLCEDIEVGQINSNIEIDVRIRVGLNKLLTPDPARANELRRELSKGLEGFVPRIWKVAYVQMISTGTFKIYADICKERYFDHKIPVVSFAHGSSEGMMGFCMEPKTAPERYHLSCSNMFWEFLPVEDEEATPLTIDQVKVGKLYEVVLSSFMGFFRYRVGDVIKIVELKQGGLPVYEFQYRAGQMLNVLWEKTPEGVFMDAVTAATRTLDDVTLADYTATENINVDSIRGITSDSRHYVLFLEVDGKSKTNNAEVNLTREQVKVYEDTLRSSFDNYRILQDDGKIQPMEVLQVQPGTFSSLRKLMLERNRETTAYQFKMPRALRKEEYLKMLLDSTL